MERAPTFLPLHHACQRIGEYCSTDVAIHLGNSNGSVARNRQSSHPGRRRSTVLMSLQLNDPTMPPPGEMVHEGPPGYRTASPQSIHASPITSSGEPQLPQHFRAPSLGEIHQELEQEQEAQVVCYHLSLACKKLRETTNSYRQYKNSTDIYCIEPFTSNDSFSTTAASTITSNLWPEQCNPTCNRRVHSHFRTFHVLLQCRRATAFDYVNSSFSKRCIAPSKLF